MKLFYVRNIHAYFDINCGKFCDILIVKRARAGARPRAGAQKNSKARARASFSLGPRARAQPIWTSAHKFMLEVVTFL